MYLTIVARDELILYSISFFSDNAFFLCCFWIHLSIKLNFSYRNKNKYFAVRVVKISIFVTNVTFCVDLSNFDFLKLTILVTNLKTLKYHVHTFKMFLNGYLRF